MTNTVPLVLTIYTGDAPDIPAVEEQFNDFDAARTRLEQIATESGDSIVTADAAQALLTFTLTSADGQTVGHGAISTFE